MDRDSETFTSTKYVNLEEVDDDLMDLRRSMSRLMGCATALAKLIQREFSQGPLTRVRGVPARLDQGHGRQRLAEQRIRLRREGHG